MSIIKQILNNDLSSLVIKELQEQKYLQQNSIWDNNEDIFSLISSLNESSRDKLIKYLSDNNYNFNQYVESKQDTIFNIIKNEMSDHTLSLLFNNKTSESICSMDNFREYSYKLLIDLFKTDKPQSIKALKDNWWILSKLDIFSKIESDKNETIREDIQNIVFQTRKNIEGFCAITYSEYGSIHSKILTKMIDSNEDKNEILNFIDTTYLNLPEHWKENVIAYSLVNQKNTKITEIIIEKIYGCNISEYKPIDIPIWTYIDQHQSKNIFKTLISNNVNIFDYNKKTTDTFLSNALSYKRKHNISLKDLGLNEEKIIRKLIEPSGFLDENGNIINNFSLMCSTFSRDLAEFLTLSDLEISSIFPKYKKIDSYSKEKQLTIVEDILNQTYLAKPFTSEPNDYNSFFQERRVNLSCILNANYNSNKSLEIINRHLELLEYSNNDTKKEIYLKALFDLTKTYNFCNISVNHPLSKTVTLLTNYIKTYRTDFWKLIGEELEKKPGEFNSEYGTDFSKQIKTEIKKCILENTLAESKAETITKKIKI